MRYRRDFSTKEGAQMMRVIKDLAFGREGSQVLELALVLPLLAVIIVGVFDFGEAYNMKQKLNNAVREGARFAVGENSGVNLNTNDVSAIGAVVNNYLQNAGLTQCTFTGPTQAGTVYTFTATGTGCGSASLVVDRNYLITLGPPAVAGTHVTLTYPFTWKLGNIMKLLLPTSNLGLPAAISTDAIMQNIN
jgi:Flp pilus assembly protein TadG